MYQGGKAYIILDENLPSVFVQKLSDIIYTHSLEWVNDCSNDLGLYPSMTDEQIMDKASEYEAYIVILNGRHFKDYPKRVCIKPGWRVNTREGLVRGTKAVLNELMDAGYTAYSKVYSLL